MRFALVLVALTMFACSKPAQDAQADGCPKDLLAARGSSCKDEGKTCSNGSNVRLLMCSSGKWTEMNMPPMPQPPPSAHEPRTTEPQPKTTER